MTCRLALTAIAAVVAGSGAWAQQQPPATPTFSSTTRLVTVAVSVADRRTGAPVRGLSREDFIVESDGVERSVVQFAGDPGPVTVAVLLDASGSMAVNQIFDPAQQAATALLEALHDGVDRAAVYSFDEHTLQREGFGPVSPAHRSALATVAPFGSTSIFDAAQTVSTATAEDGHARRGVVLYTDGLDNSSRVSADTVRRLAASLDVPLYLLAVWPTGTPAKAGYVQMPESHPLQQLAAGTGGHLFAATPGVGIDRAHAELLTSLRQHYVLAFEPDPRPGWHSLTVRTRNAHSVRARTGYVVSPRS